MDFGTFVLEAVIIHQMPGGKAGSGGEEAIVYSEADVDLDPTNRSFIQRRLRATFGGHARQVIENRELESPVPDILRSLAVSSDDLVERSSSLTRLLYARQKWISPGGLVLTILGTIDSEKCVAIAKMEHQEGMRVEEMANDAGLRTFRAQYLHDLILSQGTKVFKAGIFAASGLRRRAKITGYVVDDQQSQGAVAEYFIDFLGCQFVQHPDVLTQDFLKAAQRFISSVAKNDPETNARYEIALLSEMQSNADRIEPARFAQDHLKPEHRDGFLNVVLEAAVPGQGFKKDVALVKSQIRRMRIQTARGADVLAPPEMFKDGAITVRPTDSGNSIVTVEDKVTKMTGSGSGPR